MMSDNRGSDGTVRVVTLNLWGEQPPFERRMELAVDGLRALAPDIVGLQEVREVPGQVANMARTLAEKLGWHFVFERTTPWGGGDEGLAVLSRFPIDRHEAHELPFAVPAERRICLGASVRTAHGELAFFTTHLNYRLGDGIKREAQVVAIHDFVSSWSSSLPKILVGDFNAGPDHDEIRFLKGQHTLDGRRAVYQDAWDRVHPGEPGWTWASRNPYSQRLRWLDSDRRLDYVWVTPLGRDGRGLVRDCRIVLDAPASDGAYVSDHFGLLADVQLAAIP